MSALCKPTLSYKYVYKVETRLGGIKGTMEESFEIYGFCLPSCHVDQVSLPKSMGESILYFMTYIECVKNRMLLVSS